MYDLLIRNGLVVDGTGRAAYRADIAVQDGKIAAVGAFLPGGAKETIDATGLVTTPGFIDIHTHYDAQVTWDDQVLPSSAHGVTTALIGACGIGFAPLRPGTEDWLVTLTEGVEDIPGTVLHEGIQWEWESFPEYLDALGRRQYAIDIAAHVPHSALRAYVMGKRTLDNAPASANDLEQMAQLVREGVAHGAIGFATSRLITQHFGSDGNALPGTAAAEEELLVLADAVRGGGGGVIQVAPFQGGEGKGISTMGAEGGQNRSLDDEIAMLRRISAATGQAITFTLVESFGAEAVFERAFATCEAASKGGDLIVAQFTAKPIGAITTLDGYHAFESKPSYLAIGDVPLSERVALMRDPALKARMFTEQDVPSKKKLLMNSFPAQIRANADKLFRYDAAFDYEPEAKLSLQARALAIGREPMDLYYDELLEEEGRSLMVVLATNFSAGDLRQTERMLRSEHMLLGLADGGAHVKAISDASQATFVLSHWARDRRRGPTVPFERLVNKLTGAPAALYGLGDRGVIAPGRRADLNIIDPARIRVEQPGLVRDLPGGSPRFLQEARGYAATLVAGVVTRRNGRDTGARPGRLVRGRRSPPSDGLVSTAADRAACA